MARIRPTTAGSKLGPAVAPDGPDRVRAGEAPGPPPAVVGEHAQLDPADAVDEQERSARRAGLVRGPATSRSVSIVGSTWISVPSLAARVASTSPP